MKYERLKSKCSTCSLKDCRRIWGEGSSGSKIAFIGEAPSKADDKDGRPFSGAGGGLFSWALGEAGIFRYQSWITHTVSCMPPKAKIKSLDGEVALKECRQGLLHELEWLAGQGIKVLVPMGEVATNALEIEGKIAALRGSVYELVLYDTGKNLFLMDKKIQVSPNFKVIATFIVVPTFQPSFIFRSQVAKGKAPASFKSVWVADLKKVKGIVKEGWNPPQENFTLFPTVGDLQRFHDDVKEQQCSLGVDIETVHGFNRDYCATVCIGFASSVADGLCVPILKQGGGNYWSKNDWPNVVKLLNSLLKNPLMFQNALYDVPRMVDLGLEVSMDNVEHDSMLLHNCISPELPHNLGFIVSIYGQTPNWKENFWEDPEAILSKDDSKVRTYNLRDCVVLHQIIPEMIKDLIENEMEDTYYNESLKMLGPINKMINNGILFDTAEQTKVKKKLLIKANAFEKKLYSVGKLPVEFNTNSGDDMRYFLYGVEPAKFAKIVELADFIEHPEVQVKCSGCKKKFWVRKEVANKFYLPTLSFLECPKCGENTGSPTGEVRDKAKRKSGTAIHKELQDLARMKQLVKPLYVVTNFKGNMTDGGKLSVASDGILAFQIALRTRREVIEGLKRPSERHAQELVSIKTTLGWVAIYNDWKEVHKLENDFTTYKPSLDGRLRGSYLIHGTVTGRLSMKGPNLMQVPKRAKEIRNMFIARPGYSLLSGDYTNLEVHVLAHETQEPELIPVIEGRVNQHDENTRILWGIDKDHPYWEPARDGAKTYQFARVQYGGGQRSTYQKVCLKCPNVDMTFKQFKKVDDAYFEKHKVLHAWQEQVKEAARKTRVSQTFMGRRRILMGKLNEIERQALNTPIQGGAAGVINRAMIRLDERVEKLELDALLVLQVHDQLVYEVNDNNLDELANEMKLEMERPVDFRGKLVQFPVELEVGKTWGKLKEYVK